MNPLWVPFSVIQTLFVISCSISSRIWRSSERVPSHLRWLFHILYPSLQPHLLKNIACFKMIWSKWCPHRGIFFEIKTYKYYYCKKNDKHNRILLAFVFISPCSLSNVKLMIYKKEIFKLIYSEWKPITILNNKVHPFVWFIKITSRDQILLTGKYLQKRI